MRTKPANRYNHEKEHASYGIYNWFKSKGITNKDVIKETMANFCLENGFKKITTKIKQEAIINLVQNRFPKFCHFATKFLTDNNYI